MGMEIFKKPIEPIQPDKPEQIDDVVKAQAMAEAGNHFRSQASRVRSQVKDGSLRDTGWAGSVEKTADRIAEINENRAARIFELKKTYPEFSDEEIDFVNWKQEEKRTPEEISSLFRSKFGKNL